MPDTARTAPPYAPMRFGPDGRFELQPGERRLLIGGQPASLGARALDLLITLAARPDHLIGKNELLDLVWPGLVVEEANLHVQISHLRKLLGGDVIATVPGRGYRFVASLSAPPAGSSAAVAAPSAASEPAPAMRSTRLFGRAADLATLQGLLREGGCVTLVGPSGVGKTSLARGAAAGRDGRSVWVDLAGLVQGSQVPQALARALGASLDDGDPGPALARALQSEPTLVVLDNAEHLVEATAALVAQLAPLPGMAVLVTSQLPLAVATERVQRLEPLRIEDAATGASVDGGAVALLAARVAAADHRFALNDSTRPVLAEICAQLDGLPLALEMAAARVPMLGLFGVRDALAQRFAVLTNGHRDAAARHRTLHHALDWSYRLLGAEERRLLRAFGVFAGGFTLELAVALVGDEVDDERRWDVIDRLSTLVDRSMVTASADDPPRYRLLQTVRAFALERLAEAVAPESEEPAVRLRHATAVLAVFEPYRAGDPALQARCNAEMENMREAIAWARVNDLEMAARLSAAASPPTTFNAWRQEAGRWLRTLQPAMESPAGLALPLPVQAAWWPELARALVMRSDPGAAEASRRAYQLLQPLDDPARTLFAAASWVRSIFEPGQELDRACKALTAQLAALPAPTPRQRLQVRSALTMAARRRNDHEAVLAGRFEELALARQIGSPDLADAVESNLVIALYELGRFAESAARGLDLLRRIEARGQPSGNLPWVFSGLFQALVELGRADEALSIAPRAWAACELQSATYVLHTPLAMVAVARGRFDDAARLLGRIRHLLAVGERSLHQEDGSLRELHERLSAAIGVERVDVLLQEGRRLEEADVARWVRAAGGDAPLTAGAGRGVATRA